MGSIESPLGSVRPLSLKDLPGALRLSASAGWNQNEADWRYLLAAGEGWGIERDGELAASTVVLPYQTDQGPGFAWISMVLVLPGHRRHGLATQLLQHALQALEAQGRTAVLDATPAGHAVYQPLGFGDSWAFARYRREAVGNPRSAAHVTSPQRSRAMTPADWASIAQRDRIAFGGDRLALLQNLAQRWPQAARVVEQGGELLAYAFGREGREARQIGPLVSVDIGATMALLEDLVAMQPGTLYIDLADRHVAPIVDWLKAEGFVQQRPFTRMLRPTRTSGAPGNEQQVVLVAGPELG
jgi:ribosomal protein S18 acetylase RimI-like enzyme